MQIMCICMYICTSKLGQARAQIDQLRKELLELKAKDEEFVASWTALLSFPVASQDKGLTVAET